MKIRIAAVWVVLVGGMVAQIESSSPPTVRGQKAVSSQPAKIDPAKEEDIRKLMNLVGTRTLVLQMMQGMEQNMKPLMSSSLPPGEYRDKLIDLFFAKFHAKASSQQILDLAVPSYDKYYTAEEIKGLIKFYESPLGEKTVSVLPKLMGELQAAGSKWGEGLGRECMQEVLTENPELAQGLEAAAKRTQPR